ncbi:uncharacterized protein [Montipora capricornis]|uniref:uncharacterized protein isoform X2 n=1 Tax=Montipora capricornis TaxID=246305 RepID=UPI0035F1D00B
MIWTRSQSRLNTRSSGRAPSQMFAGRKHRPKSVAKSKSKKSNHLNWRAELKALKQKIDSILWNLFVNLFPHGKIVLEQFRSSNPVFVLIVIVVCLTVSAVYPFWGRTGSILWFYRRNTAEIPSINFNEVLWPPRHRWIWRKAEVLNITTQITKLCEDNDGRQVHMYLIGGPGSGKSELVRQVGLHLKDVMKIERTRPVDIITIQADSGASLMSSLADAVFALCNNSGQKADGIKQMKEELNFRFNDLFSNEGKILKTEMRVKVLFTKLKELFRERNSQPVMIFDGVQDLKLLFNYLNLEPGSKHFSTFVIIITLQKRVSLERLSPYVKVTGKEQDQSLSSHQVIREAFRHVCRASSKNPNCLNSRYCYLTAISSTNNERSTLKEVFTRLTLSIEQELNATFRHLHSLKINASWMQRQHSFDSQHLDVLTSLYFFSIREHLQVEDLISTRFLDMLLRLISYISGFWPALLRPTSNKFRLAEIVNLTNDMAVKGMHHNLQTFLLIVCLHSGATKLHNQHLMSALNKTTLGILQILRNITMSKDRTFVLNILGDIYRALGYPYKSRELHELALQLHQKNRNVTINPANSNKRKSQTNHKDPGCILEEASTLHKLGVINRYLSNLSAAQATHETSLELLQKLFGLHHPFVAGSLLNLATVYSRQNKYNKALEMNYRSLAMLQEIFGPRHANVGRVLITMGTVYYKFGKFNDAINTSKLGLEILEEFHGTNHPHVAEALNFLGFMYRDNGNLQKAQEVLEHSVSIKEKVFDKYHFILGEALNDLGVLYTSLGEVDKATVILERALNIFKHTWGKNHSSVAVALNSLGAAYCQSKQPQKAMDLHQEALKILLTAGKEDIREHSVAETRHLLGKTYRAMKNRKDARVMFHLSFKGFSHLYGREHWRVQSVLQDLNSLDGI